MGAAGLIAGICEDYRNTLPALADFAEQQKLITSILLNENSEDIFDFCSLYRMGIFHIVSVKENTLGNRKFSKIKTEMEKSYNCQISTKDVAERMNIEPEKINFIINFGTLSAKEPSAICIKSILLSLFI